MTKTTEIDISLDEVRAEPEVALTQAEESRMKEMLDSNVFYGHVKSRTNPKMRSYIASTKSGVEVIDLLKTSGAVDRAAEAIKEKVRRGGTVLFVGTSSAAKFATKDVASRLMMPYVTQRWLGGTLTNFKTINTRVNHFKKLEEDKATGKLIKYTKKERLNIDIELLKFDRFMRGIEKMDKLPSIVVVADLGENEIVAREARRMKIPVVGFVNTTGNPDLVDYSIPANDRNPKSVALILAYLEKAVTDGKQMAVGDEQARAAKLAEDSARVAKQVPAGK